MPNPDNPFKEFSFRSRRKTWEQLKQLQNQPLEIVIVGGGIVGAGLLRELSLRGVSSVYLFEKNDFASGTSGASSKLIHAGIRYLEQVWDHLLHFRLGSAWTNFQFVVSASRERKILGGMAPHLIQPKPIYFTLAKTDPRPSFSVMAGIWLYFIIQILQGQFFPLPKSYFCRKGITKALPEVDASKVKAAFTFWDSETDDARLVIENLQSAHRLGGTAMNYVELLDYQRLESFVLLTLKDKETGETIQVRTKRLINASGAFVDAVRSLDKNASHPIAPFLDRVAGSHMDIYPAIGDKSYYVSAKDNRLVFLLCRNEDGLVYTRVGTTERPLSKTESSDRPEATSGEIEYLTSLLKEYFPKAVIDETTIIKTDAGIRPLRSQVGLDAFHKSREHDIIEENGVLHVVGVKLTDFRRVACEIAERLSLPEHRIEPLRALNASKTYLEKNIGEVVNQTMTIHWDDYVFRRAGLKPLLQARQDPDAFQKSFEAFSDCLDWTPEKREQEWKKA